MALLMLGIFLIIEGVNRIGLRFPGDEIAKGILLVIAGVVMVIGNL